MEIAIAVGIGIWFTLTIVASCIAVFRSFKDVHKEENKK